MLGTTVLKVFMWRVGKTQRPWGDERVPRRGGGHAECRQEEERGEMRTHELDCLTYELMFKWLLRMYVSPSSRPVPTELLLGMSNSFNPLLSTRPQVDKEGLHFPHRWDK